MFVVNILYIIIRKLKNICLLVDISVKYYLVTVLNTDKRIQIVMTKNSMCLVVLQGVLFKNPLLNIKWKSLMEPHALIFVRNVVSNT